MFLKQRGEVIEKRNRERAELEAELPYIIL